MKLVREMDLDGDGKVDATEFVRRFMEALGLLDEAHFAITIGQFMECADSLS